VVVDATAIEIVFSDGSKATAAVKGTDPQNDLAVVSVKASDLSKKALSTIRIATLGNSDTLRIGETAIAIGNALGYGQSTTVGVISALGREVNSSDGTKMTLIQTDAAINPGNSGGALLNAKGEVVGINNMKYADTDVEGMGYAIPISVAIPIINELMTREVIDPAESGYLGISGLSTMESPETFGMPLGVYIYTVSEGSPAEKAGLLPYQIITHFNGSEVQTMEGLKSKLAQVKAGTTVTLTIQSQEKGKYVEKTVDVVVGKRPIG
jgi:serine protease Do